MHRHYCQADTRGGVRLVKQNSDPRVNRAVAGVTTVAESGLTAAAAPILKSATKLGLKWTAHVSESSGHSELAEDLACDTPCWCARQILRD